MRKETTVDIILDIDLSPEDKEVFDRDYQQILNFLLNELSKVVVRALIRGETPPDDPSRLLEDLKATDRIEQAVRDIIRDARASIKYTLGKRTVQ